MTDSYFIKRGVTVQGPFHLEQLKRGIKSKKLKADDRIAPSKDGPWQHLGDTYSLLLNEDSSASGVDTSAVNAQGASSAQPQNDRAASTVNENSPDVVPDTPPLPDSHILETLDEKVDDGTPTTAQGAVPPPIIASVIEPIQHERESSTSSDAVTDQWRGAKSGFIPHDIAPKIASKTEIPVIDPHSLPPRARSQLSGQELVHHFLTDATEAFSQPPGCAAKILAPRLIPPSKSRKTQNWVMITSEKIVYEAQIHSSTRTPKDHSEEDLNQFEFYTACLTDVVSTKAEVVSSQQRRKVGCGQQDNQHTTTHCLVVNLVNGHFSSYVKNLQDILEVQRTIVLLRQRLTGVNNTG